jgi:hemoglobin
MKEIEDIEDIKVFVDDFYAKVREDMLIGPIFLGQVHDWPAHLEQLYSFWNASLFGVPGFRGNPFAKHAPLPIGVEHFNRWLKLFFETIDHHFTGHIAADAKNRAELMAHMFLTRLQNMKGSSLKTIA